MNRWLLIGSLAALLVGSTGCLHHNVRSDCSSGACASCDSCGSTGCDGGCQGGIFNKVGSCGAGCNGTCGDSSCGSGLLGRMCGMSGMCGHHACRSDTCTPGSLGWAEGGLNYSSYLKPGLLGHHAPARLNNRPFTPGPPTAQVGYPYYTVRGPRDFLLDKPPTIGR